MGGFGKIRDAFAQPVRHVCTTYHVQHGVHSSGWQRPKIDAVVWLPVLLSRDGTAKIADVGLARILTRADTQVSAEGTFEWAAPEVGSA